MTPVFSVTAEAMDTLVSLFAEDDMFGNEMSMQSSWEKKEKSYLWYFAVFRGLPTKGTCVFTLDSVGAFIIKVATFLFSSVFRVLL